MEQTDRTCELCGDPIDPDQAWLKADDGRGAQSVAHSGCVYSDLSDPAQHDRWMPSDFGPDQ